MAKVNIPKYPEALTTKFWDKAKGVLARITKVKTGITEELQKAKAEFDKTDWDSLVVTRFLEKNRTKQGSIMPDEVDELLRAYLELNHPRFKKLELTFYDLSQFLAKKAREFKDDEKTKGFAKAVETMADAANKFTYAVAFGTVSSDNQAEFRKLRAEAVEIKKKWDDARKNIKGMLDSAETAVKKAQKKPGKVKDYTEMWSENLRGIGAQLAMAGLKNEFSVPMKKVAKPWSQGGMPKTDGEVAKHLEDDLEYIKEFKKVADKILA